jgi:NAD(P)-dependent dehydrogenase (short-subunit alcohol dehydrogenase family)
MKPERTFRIHRTQGASMTKWTVANAPDQAGRVAVVTGANTGLGYETAAALASRGARVVLAVRNLDKGKAAADLILRRTPGADVSLQELDLTSLASIEDAAEQLRADLDEIDLLINNAGVMMTPKGTTKDGFELQFGTNHLGHFAFTGRLLDRVLATPGSRVVTVSSIGHRFGRIRFDDLQSERRYSRIGAYGQSKLANLLFTYELQRRLADTQTTATAAHPGGSSSELSRYVPSALQMAFKTLEQSTEMGALPTLRAAIDPAVAGGEYVGPGGPFELRGYPEAVSSSRRSHDVAVQRRLWTVSEQLTGVVFPV